MYREMIKITALDRLTAFAKIPICMFVHLCLPFK